MIATVLVDTNVFTARLRERSPLATSYAKHLFGQRIAVAPQTVAEARYGALNAGWGTPRMERLSRLIARARILPVDIDTIGPSPDCGTNVGRLGTVCISEATMPTSGSRQQRSAGASRS